MDLDQLTTALFDLDTHVTAATGTEKQPMFSSEECTSDTCTQTCSGCRP